MSQISYLDRRVLVIDDQPEARAAVRSMIKDFGAKQVDVVAGGEDAIETMQKHTYDLVLSDYNLGAGKDGQQILEEVRHAKLMKNVAAFIMITAENTVEMVMGALEYSPDGYLTKPFTKLDLRTRLNKLLEVKEAFFKIEDAIDRNQLNQAITYCDELITQKSPLAIRAYRAKGQLLLDVERFDEAQAMYEEVIAIRPLAWALLGLGKACFFKKDYALAKEKFSELIKENQAYVQAYDWLAKTHLALGNVKEAQQALETAVERSPKAVLRQMELGKIASQNNAWETAEKAFRKAVSLGLHSCHKKPDNYLGLARSLQEKINPSNDKASRDAATEAFRALDSVQREYKDEAGINIKATILKGETHYHSGKNDLAKQAIETAHDLYVDLGDDAPLDLSVDMAKGFAAVGQYEQAEQLASQIQERLGDEADSDILADIHEQINNIQEEVKRESLNNEAVALFQKGELSKSVELFLQAAESPRASQSVLLNTVQACIELAKKERSKQPMLIDKCKELFARLKDIKSTSHRYERLQQLKKLFHELTPA